MNEVGGRIWRRRERRRVEENMGWVKRYCGGEEKKRNCLKRGSKKRRWSEEEAARATTFLTVISKSLNFNHYMYTRYVISLISTYSLFLCQTKKNLKTNSKYLTILHIIIISRSIWSLPVAIFQKKKEIQFLCQTKIFLVYR